MITFTKYDEDWDDEIKLENTHNQHLIIFNYGRHNEISKILPKHVHNRTLDFGNISLEELNRIANATVKDQLDRCLYCNGYKWKNNTYYGTKRLCERCAKDFQIIGNIVNLPENRFLGIYDKRQNGYPVYIKSSFNAKWIIDFEGQYYPVVMHTWFFDDVMFPYLETMSKARMLSDLEEIEYATNSFK